MSIPHQVAFDFDPARSTPITPSFPDWEKSFVSGPKSTLFKTIHSISDEDSLLLFSRVRFLEHAEGPPGHVHGGATAGLFDELMGIVVWHHHFLSVTQSIQVHYKKAIPLPMEAIVLTRLVQVEEKTVEVNSTLYNTLKVPYVSAQGIFHRLSEKQLGRFKV
jgi:acyl-coenzyme A thioesterase PaaI-like protein